MAGQNFITDVIYRWRRRRYGHFCWLLFVLAMGLAVACSDPTVFSTGSNRSTTCGSPLGGPSNNPVQDMYGPAAFAWTNEIQWQCVYNIKDFAGPSDTDRYMAARDAAIEGGGGVIYLPAETYYFQDDLPLEDGIVLRGDPPEQPNAKAEDFVPPTRLVFPEYEPSRSGDGTPNDTAFKHIITPNPNADSNLGLVYLDIDRAGVELTGNPDTGTMTNRLVFSVRSNNVAEPAPTVPDLTFQPGWLRYGDLSAANIRLTTRENALVANNRLNDAITDTYNQSDYVVLAAEGGDIITYPEGEKVPFTYTDHQGIVVNRIKASGFTYAQSAEAEPGLFRSGITIQDNWVFKTMGAGIRAAGEGLTIRRNVISDEKDKVVWVDPTGTRQPDGVMTFENRAIDWSGHNVTIEGNNFVVYRHKIMDTPDFSADGEGVLIQSCCGGTSVNGVLIHRNTGQGPIDIDKVPDVQRVVVRDNQITSTTANRPALYINVNTDKPNPMEEVLVQANQLQGGILTLAGLGGQDITVQNNQGEGTITYSCGIEVRDNSGFVEQPCVESQQPQQPDV